MRINWIITSILTCSLIVAFSASGQNKYVGTKQCGMCHKTEKQGSQLGIWQKSKHADAYNVLKTEKAKEYAKARGITKPPTEVAECLECHTLGKTVDPKLFEKTFDIKDGVQCETCHGAGSAYKSILVMKDKAKSVAAGMVAFKDEAAIEKHCRTCHNEKSPGFKGFKFAEMWPKIEHNLPKSK